MKMKDLFKMIGVMLLVLMILVLVHTIRNYFIVKSLQDKIAVYKTSTNYHIKSITNESRGIILNANFYRKDNNYTSKNERDLNGDIASITVYGQYDKIEKDIFIENKDTKVAILESDGASMRMEIYNMLESNSDWNTFLSCVGTTITSMKVNDKDCYVVSNYPSFIDLIPKGKNEYYIEKDSGLIIKIINEESITEREYEFDKVDDSIFIEPDLSEYEIRDN